MAERSTGRGRFSIAKISSRSARAELGWTLATTTSIQLLSTATVLALTPIAPRAASDFGVDAHVIGYQISLIYFFGALGSCVAGTLVSRYGAVRIEQIVLGLLSLGLLGLAGATIGLGIVASLFIGVAYGLQNPASSQILGRISPPHRRNIIFSIKQAGVPLGGAFAALAIPLLDQMLGWKWAMVILAVPPAMLLWNLQGHRAAELPLLQPHAGTFLRGFLSEQKQVWSNPRLRTLALVGLLYSSIQLCLSAFIVLMLVDDAGWSLIGAASVAGLVQLAGAMGRLIWGSISDRRGGGMGVLAAIGLICTVVMLAMPAIAHMPAIVQIALLCLLGSCASGWNGVAIAEMTRHCAPHEASQIVGGTMVYTFIGVVLGPSLFAVTSVRIGHYGETFAVFGVAAGLAAILCIRHSDGSALRSRRA